MKSKLVEFAESIRDAHYNAGKSQGYFNHGYDSYKYCCAECGSFGEYGVEWPCETYQQAVKALLAEHVDDII